MFGPRPVIQFPFCAENQLLAMQVDLACSKCEPKKVVVLLGSAEQVCAWTWGFVILLQRCQKEEQVLCLVLVPSSLVGALQCRANWESLQMWQRLMGPHCSDEMCGHSTAGQLRAAGHFFF